MTKDWRLENPKSKYFLLRRIYGGANSVARGKKKGKKTKAKKPVARDEDIVARDIEELVAKDIEELEVRAVKKYVFDPASLFFTA